MKIYSGILEAEARLQFVRDETAHFILEVEKDSYDFQLDVRYMDELESVVTVLVNRLAQGDEVEELELLV